MRLIDADALAIVTRGKNHHRKYVFADITDAPTIDAIPVEWLQERKHWAAIDGDHWAENIINYLLDAWLEEQEGR